MSLWHHKGMISRLVCFWRVHWQDRDPLFREPFRTWFCSLRGRCSWSVCYQLWSTVTGEFVSQVNAMKKNPMIILPFTCASLHFHLRGIKCLVLLRGCCAFVCLCVFYWKKPFSDPLRTCSVTVTLMFTVGGVRWREVSRERLGAAGENHNTLLHK